MVYHWEWGTQGTREISEATEGDPSISESLVTGFPVHFIPRWHALSFPGARPLLCWLKEKRTIEEKDASLYYIDFEEN